VTCIYCNRNYYKHELKTKDADTTQFEKEVSVRKELSKVFSKRLSDFVEEANGDAARAMIEWDQYEEQHEKLVRMLSDGTDTATARKEVAAELSSGRAGIQRASKQRSDESRAAQVRIHADRDRRLQKMAAEVSVRERRREIMLAG